ncbi:MULTISPECIES: SAM-dependent methyltransferase [Actinomadura]|nr:MULTISPECIES: SAM-dependent methyltransferase [Actinomadura]
MSGLTRSFRGAMKPRPNAGDQRGPTSRPAHSARVWDYWLGGKNFYSTDAEVAIELTEMLPHLGRAARAQRGFQSRAVRHLAESGVDQFLDIGVGLPARYGTHEVAQAVVPSARVVYADKDPVVMAHARALMTGRPEGAVAHLLADLRDPDAILLGAAETLDLRRPVALLLLGVLEHVGDGEEAQWIVKRLLSALAPGSHLVVGHLTGVLSPAAMERAVAHWNTTTAPGVVSRTPEEISAFFGGTEPLTPGIVTCSRWRPGAGSRVPAVHRYGGVGLLSH